MGFVLLLYIIQGINMGTEFDAQDCMENQNN